MIDLYIETRLAYVDGKLHSLTAIGRLQRDKTFIAECELTGRDPAHMAPLVVRGPWTRELVK